MKFSVFHHSHRGGREINEDRIAYCHTAQAAFFILADGMGGHADGEVAAQLAVHSMQQQFHREAQPLIESPADFLTRSAGCAHQAILHYTGDKHIPNAPGTTIVAALIQNDTVTWLHCGDSRLYWARKGKLIQRTWDHSYQEIQHHDMPHLQASQRAVNRNALFTCLGAAQLPHWDISGPHLLRHGDRLLLCSDGLWSVLEEGTLLHGLFAQSVAIAVPALVESALQIAGKKSDNVSAIAVEWQIPLPVHTCISQPVSETNAINALFASTVQAAPELSALDHLLDDDELERNIAEINAAIRRTFTGKL